MQDDETSRAKATMLAAECLAKEAEILSSLPRHPNVIQPTNLKEGPTHGFLLLRRVSTTLEELLKRWKIRSMSSSFLEDETSRNPFSFISNRRMKQERLLEEQQCRINQVGVGLSRAMAFLHSHRILYRDLKPANVGIDYEGQVRLFDFGFARTFHDDSEQDRLLTKLIGSKYTDWCAITGLCTPSIILSLRSLTESIGLVIFYCC
jgi:serine/threonine protein kinase